MIVLLLVLILAAIIGVVSLKTMIAAGGLVVAMLIFLIFGIVRMAKRK